MDINLGKKAERPFLRAIIYYPYIILLFILILAILSLTQLVDLRTGKPKLDLDPSVNSILPDHDPDRDFFEHIKTLFDGGETILIALVDDNNIFTQSNLSKVKRISQQIEQLEHVARVSSLATALNIRSENGELLIDPFFDNAPGLQSELDALKHRALNDPIYAGNLISLDARVTVIMVHLLDKPEREILANKVDKTIREIAQAHWDKGSIWLSGGAHVKAEMSYSMLKDLTTIIPLASLVMILIAAISFKTARGVLLPFITVGISVLITMAFIALMYGSLNQVTVTVPSLILVVGFAYAVHVVSNYYDMIYLQFHPEGKPADNTTDTVPLPVLDAKPTAKVMRNVTAPVVYTGITTGAGFFSLATSPLSAIQQFGYSAGFGVLVTMVVSLTFVPAMLQLLPIPKKIAARKQSPTLDKILEKLASFDARHSKAILAAGGIVVLLSAAALPNINIGTDLINSFQKSSDVHRDFYAINDTLQGANSLEIILSTTVEEGFLEPVNLKTIEHLQDWLAKQHGIGGSTSIVDYIKVLNRGFHGDDHYNIPDNRGLISELFWMGSNDELNDFIDFDYQTARLVVRTNVMDSSDVMLLSEKIQSYFAENIPSHLSASITGNSYLIAKTMDDIAIGQATSIATAFIIIYLILVVLFTSFKAGLLALIPNIIPVLLYFGILGWSGVQLNVTTGLVACIVLGIAVDDTIHLMAHFNRSAKKHADEAQGILHALKTVGRPVTYTTCALCLGFLCLLMSDMQTQMEFGVLAAVTLLGAWIVDVTFTPALAGKMKVVSLWDVLSLNLGKSPHKSIPLFKGLTLTQARITALMAEIVEYSQNERIFAIGDSGNHMYVVIDGTVSITLNREDGTLFLQNLNRGDIIGEVAMYHGERTANAYARSNVRLLCITKNDLEDIQKHHPKIAAQLYANLNEVFAGRVANLTTRISA